MTIRIIVFLLCCCLCIQGMAQTSPKVADTDKKVTRIDFTETFEDGTSGAGVLSYHSTSDSTTMVNYNFEKTGATNPYSVDYSYQIKVEKDGSCAIEMGSVLDPLSMRIDDNVEVTYAGDDLEFPAILEPDMQLKDAKGEYTLTIREARFGLVYSVAVTDRKVVRQETIEVDGTTYDAFVITYAYNIKKSVEGKTVSARAENVKEWYVPDIGALAKIREGKSRNQEETVVINSSLVSDSVSF